MDRFFVVTGGPGSGKGGTERKQDWDEAVATMTYGGSLKFRMKRLNNRPRRVAVTGGCPPFSPKS